MDNHIKINTTKSYQSGARKVNLTFDHEITIGQITGLYGPSGVGKSSLLKLISGLTSPEQGEIISGQTCWFSSSNKINVPTKDRSVAFVFQDYNLFPNMTVQKNLMYASPGNEISSFIQNLSDKLGVSDYLNSYPSELSGGQRQRAAILRAFAQEAKLILMDEPFSSLDDEITLSLIAIIKELVSSNPLTVIIASHQKDMLTNLAKDVILLKSNGEHIKKDASVAFEL